MSLAENRVLLSVKPLASCRPACAWPPPPLISRADNICPIVQCSLLSQGNAEAGTPGLATGWTKVPIVPVIALHQKLLAWKWLAFLLGSCRLKAVQLCPGSCVFQTGCRPFIWLSVSSQMQQFLPLPRRVQSVQDALRRGTWPSCPRRDVGGPLVCSSLVLEKAASRDAQARW